MSRLSEISIKNPVFAWMLMAALLLFGGISLSRMGVSQLPDVDFPVVNVSLSLEGAAPEVMEMDVVDTIEDSLSSIEGVKSISSSARAGAASVSVEFELGRDIIQAVREVETAISRAMRRLPEELDPPVVTKTNPEDQPILWLAVSSDAMSERELMKLVRDRVKDRFNTVTGIGEIFLGGYVDPSLRVWVSEKKLDRYQLTVSDVVAAIRSEHLESPSGRIETDARELNLRTLGEAPTPAEFAKLGINRRGGGPSYVPVPLSSVARVEDGLADVRRKSRSNGRAAVGLGIKKQRGANAVGVADAVFARMEEVKKELPAGVDLGVRFDSTHFIREAIKELKFTLILAALLTALVCWLFLGSFSATMNVVLAIPTSVVGSFIVLNAMGFTLNTFTLLGLSLAIGIVVDDAIMVLENIVRHRQMGKERTQAALDGSKEIYFAAVAATLSIIAIFLPVAFMKGIVGKFFFQFGVTLAVAVALSLLEAITLTPMRCAAFVEMKERTTRIGKWLESAFLATERFYGNIVPWLLRKRWTVVVLAALFTLASFISVKYLKKEFTPPEDQGYLMVRVTTPVGSSLDFTDAKMKEIEVVVSARPETASYFSAIGGFSGGQVNSGMIFLSMKERGSRPKNPKTGKPVTQQELIVMLREGLKAVQNARTVVVDPSLGGFAGGRSFPVELSIRGSKWEELSVAAGKLEKAMIDSKYVVDVDTDFKEGMPEIQIRPDRERASARGVSVSEIGEVIGALFGGVTAGKFSDGGRRYDVRVRLSPEERVSAADLSRVRVRNNRGELVSLSEVVKIEEKKTLQSINRTDRERAIALYGNVAPGVSQDEAITKVEALAKEILPPGIRAVRGGSSEAYSEGFQSLLFALILGIAVAYMILASQFNHFVHPITVLSALPPAMSGAFLALWITGTSLNVYSMIGLLLLMGIVKKNSILLVDYANQLRSRENIPPNEAIAKAAPVRLRPILMTSFATIAGAFPAALALGPGAESRIPMAITVMGGVAVSTLLTLLVVPCLYSLFSRAPSPP